MKEIIPAEDSPLVPAQPQNSSYYPLIGKNLVAVVVSGVSVVLYYLSTEDQLIMVRIDSVGGNFIINWWAGYVALESMLSSNACTTLLSVGAAIFCSSPYAIAAYLFTLGSTARKLGFAGMQLAGTTFLYTYSILDFGNNDLPKAYYFSANLIQDTFCSGNEDDQEISRTIELTRRILMKQLSLIIEEIKQGNLELQPGLSKEIPTAKHGQLNHLATLYPPTSSTPGFWQSCAGRTLSWIGYGAKQTIKLASAAIIIDGAVGYHCATEDQLTQKPFDLSDPSSWGLSSVVMLPLYYLCLKAGWNLADTLCNIAGDLVQGKPVKPTIWKVGGGCLGPLFQTLIILSAGLLSYQSGYTSTELYVQKCPPSFQFPGAGPIVNYSTDIYNGIYILYGFSDGLMGLMNLFGNDREKTYLQLLKIAETTLSEIEKMSRERFLEYNDNVLSKLDSNTKSILFGENTYLLLNESKSGAGNIQLPKPPENLAPSNTK